MRPNILYLHSHDTGRYIQPYGYNVPTPNLQAFAQGAAVFRHAFCAGPTCSPSRAALLTGQSCHSSGMLGLAHRGWKLNDYSQHLVHTLREAGYKSYLCGVQHVANHAQGEPWQVIGYDKQFENNPDDACDFLRSKPEGPFFLSVGFGNTHRFFSGKDEIHTDPRWVRPPAPLPDTAQTRADYADFVSDAQVLDRKMGAVLAALEEGNLADNTLVIITTDHGIPFPRMKCNLTDSGIGVMLMVRGPGGFEGGKVIDAMVSHVDVFPTLCELLEIDKPSWLEGVSFLPLVQGQAEKIREELYAEVTYHASYEPMRCVRTDRYKYIRRFDSRTSPVLPDCDPGMSKDYLLEQGWQEQAPDDEQLYDLIFDPNESNNLALRGRYHPQLEDMRSRLEDWMRRTDDPLQAGYVEPAPEARVNHPDNISNHEPSMEPGTFDPRNYRSQPKEK
jgi:arylsulfatase A-like enzyme